MSIEIEQLNYSAEHLNGNLKGKDILSVNQFDIVTLDHIFTWSAEMEEIANRSYKADLLSRKILTNLFYEPSTRTSSSFTCAMERLGGSVNAINDAPAYSSVVKGENLEDSIRTLECYSDIIVIRHPVMGSAAKAAAVASIPIINAGDGIGEHPTQALLDYVTVRKEQGRVDGLTITMMGDLTNGRTVHSLARLLSLYNVRLNYVAPGILRMPEEIKEEIRLKGIEQNEFEDLADVLPETDVLYMTRIQKERFTDKAVYESVKDVYEVTPKTLEIAKPTMSLMHPFPRVGEISNEVDSDPRAAYFREIKNGLYVRMVLLAGVLGKLST
jgi:aspartate carbamoyltransferase catalytic subunit